MKVKTLTFDTGGTLLDGHSGFKTGFEALADPLAP